MGQKSPNRDLGPCILEFGGTDIGQTYGGTNFRYSEEDADIMEDRFGSNPVDAIQKGSTCEVEANLTRLQIAQLIAVISASSGSGTVSGSGKMVVKTRVGYSRYDNAATLILKPIVENGAASSDEKTWLYIYRASPMPNFDVAYNIDDQRVFKVIFKAFPYHDAPSGASNRLWGIGADQ